MRIVHVATTLNIGGAQIMLRRFLNTNEQGDVTHSVVSLMPGGAIRAELEETGIAVTDLGMRSLSQFPVALRRLRRILHEQNPDIVHGWMYHGCLATGLTVPRRTPFVFGIHHSLQKPSREKRTTRAILRILAPLSRRSAAVTYCGHSVAAQHEAIGFAPKRRIVIANGIDCDVFCPDARARARLRELTGIPVGRIIIGNVTRDHPMKDVGLLVHALNRLLAEGVDAHLVFMGEGHENGTARKLSESLGISNRVTTLSARFDVARIVPGFDIFALCSAWGEAFSLAMGEAMAAGVPGVGTDVGDCRWLLGDPSRIVPPCDPLAMTQVLSRLSRLGRHERQALGARDRDRVQARFSLRAYATAHAEMYRRVASGEGGDDHESTAHALAGRC